MVAAFDYPLYPLHTHIFPSASRASGGEDFGDTMRVDYPANTLGSDADDPNPCPSVHVRRGRSQCSALPQTDKSNPSAFAEEENTSGSSVIRERVLEPGRRSVGGSRFLACGSPAPTFHAGASRRRRGYGKCTRGDSHIFCADTEPPKRWIFFGDLFARSVVSCPVHLVFCCAYCSHSIGTSTCTF